MDYTILKEDLDLMVEASRRVWHIDQYKRIQESAKDIEELITLHKTWADIKNMTFIEIK